MSIPTGFFTDITKNYYGIDPASQATEEAEVSALLWKDFLSKVATETDPYFSIISSRDEAAVRQALITLASEYMSPLTEEALTDIGYLAQELVAQRGPALANLTSKDSVAVKTLLTDLLAPHIDLSDNFIVTILPSIAEDIAVANGEKQKLYLDYLNGKLETIHTAEASIALSSSEVTGRRIIYTLYDIILALINLITTNQIVESGAVMPLVRKKEQYLELIRQLFMYRGKGVLQKDLWNIKDLVNRQAFNPDFVNSKKIYPGTEDWMFTSVAFSSDPNKYNLGYGDLTLQDIFTSMYNNIVWQSKPLSGEDVWQTNSPSFQLAGNPFLVDKETIKVDGKDKTSYIYRQFRIDITLTRNPTTGAFSATSKFSVVERHANTDFNAWYDASWTVKNSQTYTSTFTPLSTADMYESVMNSLKSTYYNAYNYGKSQNYIGVNPANFEDWTTPYLLDHLGDDPEDDGWKYVYLAKLIEPKIPWPYTIGKDTKDKEYFGGVLVNSTTEEKDQTSLAIVQNALRVRGEQNKMLNTYLESIRSKSEVVSDKMDSQSQVAETSATAKRNTINLLQSMVRQLQNLLASIFR